MKIGTWNVEYADPDKIDPLRKVLAENCADIWIFTETHDDLVPPGCTNAVHADPRPGTNGGVRPPEAVG